MCVGVVRNSRKQQRSGRSCEHRTASPSMRLDVCRNNQPQRPSHPIRSRRRPPRFDRPPPPPPPRDVIRHEETNERLEPEPHICPSIHIHAVHALELSEHSTDEWISSSELQDRRASDNVEKKEKKRHQDSCPANSTQPHHTLLRRNPAGQSWSIISPILYLPRAPVLPLCAALSEEPPYILTYVCSLIDRFGWKSLDALSRHRRRRIPHRIRDSQGKNNSSAIRFAFSAFRLSRVRSV